MGRALLLTCMGAFIILGVVQQGIQERRVATIQANADYFGRYQARNAVNGGLELGINRVAQDRDWDNLAQPWFHDFSGITVNVWVDKNEDFPAEVPPQFLRVRSESNVNNRNFEAFAFIEIISAELPEMEGALAVYGSGSTINMSGAPLKVSGFDTNPDGSAGPADPLPGIVSPDEEDDLIDRTGPPTPPYEGNPSYLQKAMDGEPITELIDLFKQRGTIYQNLADLGTPGNPKITIVEGNLEISGNHSLGGVIVVAEGASLRMAGTVTFQGLILVEGTFEAAAGTPKIYGGVILSDNALLDVEAPPPEMSLLGTPTVYYSSQVLESINQHFSNDLALGVNVDRIFY